MGSANGRVPNANQRTRTLERQAAREETGLAQMVGQAVALHLAQLLPQALAQVLAGQPWQPGCIFCVMAHKQAMAAHAEACQRAQEAGEDLPEPPALNIQQGITSAPVQQAPNVPPVALPVCYDHFEAGPQVRAVGLVDASGTPIIARG